MQVTEPTSTATTGAGAGVTTDHPAGDIRLPSVGTFGARAAALAGTDLGVGSSLAAGGLPPDTSIATISISLL
ncbi:hypothetical protein ACNTMW_00970 [Planosporangium sp. 12N6]|uniref:hypothetical protein n=1 Tax=Planosporangium spinosum TaxID=3402278 RepID=UPI003CFA9BF6